MVSWMDSIATTPDVDY